MRAAMAIELVIMEESMKRSHWYRLKSTSRWFWHWEGETENHFTAKDTWPWGRNAYGAGLGSMLWPKGFRGHRTQSSLSLRLDNDSGFVYLSKSFSRIRSMTSDTSGKHPCQSYPEPMKQPRNPPCFFSFLICTLISLYLPKKTPPLISVVTCPHFHYLLLHTLHFVCYPRPYLHLYSVHLYSPFFFCKNTVSSMLSPYRQAKSQPATGAK